MQIEVMSRIRNRMSTVVIVSLLHRCCNFVCVLFSCWRRALTNCSCRRLLEDCFQSMAQNCSPAKISPEKWTFTSRPENLFAIHLKNVNVILLSLSLIVLFWSTVRRYPRRSRRFFNVLSLVCVQRRTVISFETLMRHIFNGLVSGIA